MTTLLTFARTITYRNERLIVLEVPVRPGVVRGCA